MGRGLIVVLALVGLTGGSLFFVQGERLIAAPFEAQVGPFALQLDSEFPVTVAHVVAHRSMIAAGVIIAALLALVLAWRPLRAHGAHLRLSLAMGSASLGYVMAIHPWLWLEELVGPFSWMLAGVALVGSMLSLRSFVRFAGTYPYSIRDEEFPEREKIEWFIKQHVVDLARERGISYLHATFIDMKRALRPRAFSEFLKTGTRTSKQRHKLLDRQLHRSLQGYWLTVILGAALIVSLWLSSFGSDTAEYGAIGVALIWLFVPALVYLPACMHYWEIGYARGSEFERRTIRWMLASIYLAVVLYLGFGLVFVPIAMLSGLLGSMGVLTFLPVTFIMWLFPGAWFLLLLAIAASIFFRGAIEPTLVLKRSILYGLVAVIMTAVFVTIENLLQTAALARLGLSQQSTVIVTGTAVALALGPLRQRIEALVTRMTDALLPTDLPAPEQSLTPETE